MPAIFFQISFQRDRNTGVTTVEYNIEKRTNLDINGAPCLVLNVNLNCNVDETPWCDNPDTWHKTIVLNLRVVLVWTVENCDNEEPNKLKAAVDWLLDWLIDWLTCSVPDSF